MDGVLMRLLVLMIMVLVVGCDGGGRLRRMEVGCRWWRRLG